MQGSEQNVSLSHILNIFKHMEEKMKKNTIEYNNTNPAYDGYFKLGSAATETVHCTIFYWAYSTVRSDEEAVLEMDCYVDKGTLESLKEPEAPAFIEVKNDIETLLIPTNAIVEISY